MPKTIVFFSKKKALTRTPIARSTLQYDEGGKEKKKRREERGEGRGERGGKAMHVWSRARNGRRVDEALNTRS